MTTSLFSKIETAIKSFVQKDVLPVWAGEIEPALVSFVKQVDHDFVALWMPQALMIVTNLLAQGTALTTATISQAAGELEQAALATGKTVLTQDALTTVQAAVAHVQLAAATMLAALSKPAT